MGITAGRATGRKGWRLSEVECLGLRAAGFRAWGLRFEGLNPKPLRATGLKVEGIGAQGSKGVWSRVCQPPPSDLEVICVGAVCLGSLEGT